MKEYCPECILLLERKKMFNIPILKCPNCGYSVVPTSYKEEVDEMIAFIDRLKDLQFKELNQLEEDDL